MRLGILGGGQLARMLALAAHPLGIKTLCIDPSREACAQQVTQVISSPFEDEEKVKKFISLVDSVTYETENIPLKVAELISRHLPIYPSIDALTIAQDRLLEKNFFNHHRIPTTKYKDIGSQLTKKEFFSCISNFTFPCVLKTRRFGYDGKGQMVLRSINDLELAWNTFQHKELILEEFVNFQYEVSIIAARNAQGNMACYPLTQNYHHDGMLIHSKAPFANVDLQSQAYEYVELILKVLAYIGVLTIEFFYDGKQLIANEMAPRVHNSGHWTIEGCNVSQFQLHLHALYNFPFKELHCANSSLLYNLIGKLPSQRDCLAIPGAHVHYYGKSSRPGRKLGHITLTGLKEKELEMSRVRLEALLS